MNKLIIAVSTATILTMFSAAALAAETSGVIKEIDEHANSVTLEDDTVYMLPETFSIDTIAEGDTIQIIYDTDEQGQNVSTQIVPQP